MRLDGAGYLEFLTNELPYLLMHLPPDVLHQLIFMHDGAPAHFAQIVRDYLDLEYPGWIGRGGPVRWPPRSPDLTPLDFFLWGYLKEIVYAGEPPADVEILRNRIIAAAENVPYEMIDRATQSVSDRALVCIEQGGAQFEQCLE